MEEERAVHPIVPNKSLDFEGFTLREQNAICRRLRQRLPGMATLQPAPGFSLHAQYVMTAIIHFPLTQSLLGPQTHLHYMIATSGIPGDSDDSSRLTKKPLWMPKQFSRMTRAMRD
jgi:hypothetical protein